MKTKEGKAFYANRKSTVEPVLGIIKTGDGIPPVPAQEPPEGQWRVGTAAMYPHNLKRMHKLTNK